MFYKNFKKTSKQEKLLCAKNKKYFKDTKNILEKYENLCLKNSRNVDVRVLV